MAKKSSDTKKSILPEAGNLEQIRDILFGKSMKEFENRFGELEKSLIKEVSILRDDAKKMFSTLESFVKEELNSQSNQLKAEAEERDEADQKLSSDREALAKKFSAFEKESNKTHSDIRSQILDLTRKFSDELSESRAEIMESMKKSANELQNQKTDRSKLASLLTEMALRISDDESSEDNG